MSEFRITFPDASGADSAAAALAGEDFADVSVRDLGSEHVLVVRVDVVDDKAAPAARGLTDRFEALASEHGGRLLG